MEIIGPVAITGSDAAHIDDAFTWFLDRRHRVEVRESSGDRDQDVSESLRLSGTYEPCRKLHSWKRVQIRITLLDRERRIEHVNDALGFARPGELHGDIDVASQIAD